MQEINDINLKMLIEDETGERFNRSNKIRSPFNSADKTPSFCIYFNSNQNKMCFKDFSTGATGDSIDFIMQYKGLNYAQAREYLGLTTEKTELEKEADQVKGFIDWQIKNWEELKGAKLLGLFQFTDENGKSLYYKAKILKADNKKITPYYHIENEKVKNSRGIDKEYPYNYYNCLKALRTKRNIIIVEGEKDANTLNNLLGKNYVAISLKNCKDLEFLKDGTAKILIIGDTGAAGEIYVDNLKNELLVTAKEFRIVKLNGLLSLGDNKDVTDWLEAGHTKEELLLCFRRALDLKSPSFLQQDNFGIYKSKVFYAEDGKSIERIEKVRITDFKLLSANKLRLIEEDKEGVKLVLKSFTGKEYERTGDSNIFNDIRTFRNFLNTMDLNFLADKTKDVVALGKWINDFFAIDNEEIHKGVQFLKDEEKNIVLVTQEGSITKNGKYLNKKCNLDNNADNIDMIDIEPITAEEMKELSKHIINFIPKEKALTVLGTIINNLCVCQTEELKIKLHHLLIVGESGSGKSDILSKYIAPILGIQNIKGIGNTTAWAFDKDLTTGNYVTVYDEFKPSMFSNQNKMKNISDSLRSLFDRSIISKGCKDFKVRNYRYMRPIILAGEESYPNSETALITRSAIIYISPSERTAESTESYKWLCENEKILKKFGRSLINIVLNLSTDDYKALRVDKDKLFSLKDRPLNTALNIYTGISIYNKLLLNLGLTDHIIEDYVKLIEENLKEEVLEGSENTKSIVEQMLLLFDEMISNNRTRGIDNIVIKEKDCVLIRTSEMINQIHEFCKNVGSAELIPLKLKDFKKQAKKSGYLTNGRKAKRINNNYGPSKVVQFDVYDISKLRALNVNSLAPLSEFERQIEESYKVKNIYKGMI